jgi:NifU-like protein involved in Fe-S cluster formation
MKYSDLTWRYFEIAPRAGVLEGPGTFRGTAGSRSQGTWVQFDIQAPRGAVEEARFLVFGCPHTIAVAAWITEQAIGRPIGSALRESAARWSERFEVPVEKRGRLLVIEDAWTRAVAAYDGRLASHGG